MIITVLVCSMASTVTATRDTLFRRTERPASVCMKLQTGAALKRMKVSLFLVEDAKITISRFSQTIAKILV